MNLMSNAKSYFVAIIIDSGAWDPLPPKNKGDKVIEVPKDNDPE